MTKPSQITASDRSSLDVAYWTAQLAQAPALLELASDRPRPAVRIGAAGTVSLVLTVELTAALRRFSERHGATLFMTFVAGWSVLLSRLTAQTDVVIGTPIVRGPRTASDPPADSVVNTVALRVRLDKDPSVAELLGQIKPMIVDACAHADTPFAIVVDAIQPPHSLNHHPIFQVTLELSKSGDNAVGSAPLKLSASGDAHTTAPIDLSLSLSDSGSTIVGILEYATDLFDCSTIERMVGHWRTLLEGMVADDRQCISELNLLTHEQRQRALVDWNATAANFPNCTLPELLAAQVARTPNAEAIVDDTRILGYAELDRAANSLAAALRERGVGLETVVGVALYRSLETVVAALAILKAGAVYLPLDPAYPDQRLAFMLHDAGAQLVITDQNIACRLPAEVPQWRIDQSVRDATPAPTALTPQHLAYIVYTSGSTGDPKGVAISHASAVNLAFARTHGHDPIAPGDRVLAAISVGFDVSIGQLVLPLLFGACVVIAPELRTLSAEAFWALLAVHQVSHINSVPSFFDTVLDAAASQPGLRLKRLMLGGESLSGALCARLRAALPGIELFNMYGPSEACIDATAYAVPDPVDPSLAILPIGRPLANYRAYVLDARLKPLPPGVAGELFLGGVGLARGYIRQPALTADRFLADPFGPPGARLYRTGDRALWRADGTLLFLGRRDEQLKIRGFRIEPGEIEAALRSHPKIAQVAVVAHTDLNLGTVLLVAYIVPNGTAPAISDLRDHLAQHLPAHMIPGAFVPLNTLPLTPNGKLDRKALPAPNQTLRMTAQYEAPIGEVETAIAQIWQMLLGLERVGRFDNFFDLGGNSLLIFKFFAIYKSKYRGPMALPWIFRAPTPAQLAALVNQTRTEHAWKHLVALTDGGDRSPLFCLNGFDGDVDDYLNIIRFLDPSVPVYGLQVGSDKNSENFHETLDTRMDTYQQEIRSVQPAGPYRICGFSFGGSEAFDLARRFEDAGEEVLLILLDAYRPSRQLVVSSWLPRILSMVQAHKVLSTAWRKLKNLFTFELHRWLTGKDKDLRRALVRSGQKRKYTPFAGRTILIKSTGIEAWAFQPQLDGYNGWKKYVTGPFDVIHLQYGHSGLIKGPGVKSVASHLNEILCN